MAAVERRRTLSLSYFTARNAATNAELPSTLSYFFSHSEACYIYPITGGAYSTSPQLQLHLLLPRLSCNKSNVFLAEAYLSLPSFTPLLSTILTGLRREWLFSFGSSSTAQTAARRKEKEIEERRGRRGRGIFLGGISPSLFKCSAIEE